MILRIEDITVDQSINLRAVDMVTVAQYSEAMERGDKFPAIGVVDDSERKWLYAGFHRIQAAQEAGLEHFEAEVKDGTRRDAEALACAENAVHGRPRSNQEKRDGVGKMLELEPDWSDRQIAKWCKVSNRFVSNLRNHTVNVHSINQERTFIHHKTGQPTTMKTGNIGIRPESPDGYRGKNSHDGNLANRIVATCHVCDQSYDGTKIKYCPYCYYTPDQRSDYLQAERQKRQEQDSPEELPAVKAEPDPGIVVEFDGQQIKTLDDLMRVKTPDQKLLDQFFELDLAVIKVRKLVTEFSAYPLTKIMSILYGHDDIIGTLSYQATSLQESAQFYKELSNGEESASSN